MKNIHDSSIPYEDTFGGRIVRHRNERDMTEQNLADEIKRVVKSEGSYDGDTVVKWERNRDVPRSPEVFKALTEILINENDRVPDDKKETARKEFAQAFADSKAYVDKTYGPQSVVSEKFGELITYYRRQRGMVEDTLAAQIFQRAVKPPQEDVDKIDHMYIGKIQAGATIPSKEFVLAMATVFNRKKPKDDVNTKPGRHFPEEDKAELFATYDLLPKPKNIKHSAESTGSHRAERRSNPLPHDHGNIKVPVTDEIREMRNQIRALFASPSGKLPTLHEMDDALANADSNSRLRTRHYVNCFGVRSQFVYPASIKSFDNTKEKFALVLMAIGKQDEVDDFQKKFDKLRDLIISARQSQETHLALPNGRTSKDQRVATTPETRAEIVTAYAANPKTKQIAAEFGVSATSVLRFVKAANEKVMTRGRPPAGLAVYATPSRGLG